MGTRFIASREANAAQAFKDRIVELGGADTQITRCYSGKPMRVLNNPYVDERERDPDGILPFPQQMNQSMERGIFTFGHDEAVDPERTCMPSGQGIGGIDEILPAAEIVRRVVADAEATIERLYSGAVETAKR